MTQFQKKRVNCDYGVSVHQIYLVIGEKLRKQERKPNPRFTKPSRFRRPDGGYLTVVRTHVKPYAMPLFKGYEIASTTITGILS